MTCAACGKPMADHGPLANCRGEGATVEHDDGHDARDAQDSLRALLSPWRVGRRVSRNVYAQVEGDDPDRDGWLIGQFDTGQLAREAVYRHNDSLERLRRRAR